MLFLLQKRKHDRCLNAWMLRAPTLPDHEDMFLLDERRQAQVKKQFSDGVAVTNVTDSRKSMTLGIAFEIEIKHLKLLFACFVSTMGNAAYKNSRSLHG